MPFERAHDFIIKDSVLNEVHGDINNVINNISNGHNTGWDPLKLLFDAATPSALHNSEDSFPRVGCHPGTRATVLREIMDWREGSDRMLWLYGAAGAGKTAIAQTVADRCATEGRRVATFLFLRGDPKRSHSKHFCATLATQIYSMIPEVRHLLRQAIINNPLIFGQSLDIQFKTLFVKPLQTLAPVATDMVVLIDGLDECQEPRIQNEILLMIGNSLRTSPPLPARFLIASRPEPNIRKTFDCDSLRQITRHILLDDHYKPSPDIHIYLQTGFSDIHEKHEGMKSVAIPWPSDDTLHLLVSRSSGQFIYAATVLKFVGDENFLPVGRLKSVIDASDPRALSTLDDLYMQILSTCHPDNTDRLRAVLGMILIMQEPKCELIDSLLGLETGQSRLVLRGLHSLLSIPDLSPDHSDLRPITVLHKSFSDFLQDPLRSARFFVDATVHHGQLAKHCMQWILERQEDILLRRLEGTDRHRCDYAILYWSYHVAKSPPGDADFIDILQQFEHNTYLLDGFEPMRLNRSRTLDWLRESSEYLTKHTSNGCDSWWHARPIWRLFQSSWDKRQCAERLIESFTSRRLNILVNFTSQWSINPPLESPGSTADRYVAGDSNTAAEGDKWGRAAILHAIQDMSSLWPKFQSAPYDAIALAKILDDDLASAVRQFQDSTLLGSRPEEGRIEYSEAILDISRRLTSVEYYALSSESIHPTLAEDFVRALRQMHNLYMVDLRITNGSLNIRDICLCIGDWPRLASLNMSGFESGREQRAVFGHEEVSEPVCQLSILILADESILGPQLRFLTMSSHSSITYVRLDKITGLSNTDLREWLSEIAPSLIFLNITGSFPRALQDEEHAVDDTIHMMHMLESARFGGDVVSSLAIERKPKNKGDSDIYINGAPSVDEPGLSRALGHAGFTEVRVNDIVVLEGSRALGEEAIRLAVQKDLAPQPL